MKVHGYEVTPKVEAACLQAMRGHFAAADITLAAKLAGAPTRDDICYRIADRLIQRERKAGRIKRKRNFWVKA